MNTEVTAKPVSTIEGYVMNAEVATTLVNAVERVLILTGRSMRKIYCKTAVRRVLHHFNNSDTIAAHILDVYDWTAILMGTPDILDGRNDELAKIAYCAYRDCR